MNTSTIKQFNDYKILTNLYIFYFITILYAGLQAQTTYTAKGYVTTPDSTGFAGIEVIINENGYTSDTCYSDSTGYFELSTITGIDPPYNPPVYRKIENVTIFNILGQKINHFNNPKINQNVLIWNGTNINGKSVAVGVYIAVFDDGEKQLPVKFTYVGQKPTFIPSHNKNRELINNKLNKPTEIFTLLFRDTLNRLESDVTDYTLPDSNIFKILQEIFICTAPDTLYMKEGDTTAIAKNWFIYATGLADSLDVMPGQFSKTGEGPDSIYVIPNDLNQNGLVPIYLISKAQQGTKDTTSIIMSIADMATIDGQLVDDMKYERLNGILLPDGGLKGKIYIDNKEIETDSLGNFLEKVDFAPEYIITAQGMNAPGDTTSFKRTTTIQGADTSGYKLHVMSHQSIIDMGLDPQDFYNFAWEANFSPNGGANYSGKKGPDWFRNYHGIYERSIYLPQLFQHSEMDYLEDAINDSLNSIQQIALPIFKYYLPDSADITTLHGETFWFKHEFGPLGAIGVWDADGDGYLDNNVINIRFANSANMLPILQEGLSAIAGPWSVNDNNQRLIGKTVLRETQAAFYITSIDKMLLRIVENYGPKELIDNILGGVPNPVDKQLVQELMQKIEGGVYGKKMLEEKIIPEYNRLIFKQTY